MSCASRPRPGSDSPTDRARSAGMPPKRVDSGWPCGSAASRHSAGTSISRPTWPPPSDLRMPQTPVVVNFVDDDRAEVLGVMAELAMTGAGWLNFEPEVDPDDLPPD